MKNNEILLNPVFKPRDYQLPLFDAIENKGYKRVIAILPRRCLSGNSSIVMANGSWMKLKDLQIGDLIASWDGQKIVPDTVNNIWKTGRKKTVILQSPGYLPITTSKDHRFATLSGTNAGDKPIAWQKAHDIKAGRLVLNYAGMPLGNKHDPDLAEFLGYMTFKGKLSEYAPPKFFHMNSKVLSRVEYLAKELFDNDSSWRSHHDEYELLFTSETHPNKITELFHADGQALPLPRKKLLSILWEFDRESLGRFFAAVISSNGNLYMQKERVCSANKTIPPANKITLNCGMSDELGYDIYWLLRKMGIVAQVPYREKAYKWKVTISKNASVKDLLSNGIIYGKEEQCLKMLSNINDQPRTTKIWNGCYRSRIIRSESHHEDLYDIQTTLNHNFIANGYVVHNSGKDITAFNLTLRQAMRVIGVYFYIFPTYAQGRKVIWDSITNEGKKFLDFIPKEVISATNSTEMKISLTNGSIIQLVGSDNIDCFDEKTEILTLDGWKLFKDLIKSDAVATLKNGYLEYEIPSHYVEYDYSGKMYEGKGRSLDFLVTPNHRFYVCSFKGLYKFKDISDPTIRHDSIPSISLWKGTNKRIFVFLKLAKKWICGKGRHAAKILHRSIPMKDFVALLGIYLSKGSTYQDQKINRVIIFQKNEHVKKEISKLLDRIGINYSYSGYNFSFEDLQLCTYFTQFGKQYDRFIPKDIKSLSRKHLQILFDWLVKGNGKRTKSGTFYYSTSKKLIDDVQELLIKLGFSGTVHLEKQLGGSFIQGREVIPKRPLYSIRLKISKFKRLQSDLKSYINEVDYTGKVYCVSVSSGIIKVRRNGKEMWSGNSIVGTNPRGLIFSEMALQDPRAYQFMRPILTANDGWAMFLSTPRGKNFFYDLYKIGLQNPDHWFVYKLTVEDTKHISLEDIEQERKSGEMSEDLVMQEYFTSFDMGVEGSYYSKYIDKIRTNNQITDVPYNPGHKVHTAWDLGMRDSTCVIFFQTIGQAVRIIDSYENSQQGLVHYIKLLQSKPYIYGKHIAPHDIKVRELGSGMSRLEIAKSLGVSFTIAPSVSVADGIEVVRTTISILYIDQTKCANLIKAIENYRQEYDPKKKVYQNHPLHNWASHFCDCLRYLCISLPKTADGLTPTDLEKRYREAMYGNQGNLPSIFRT